MFTAVCLDGSRAFAARIVTLVAYTIATCYSAHILRRLSLFHPPSGRCCSMLRTSTFGTSLSITLCCVMGMVSQMTLGGYAIHLERSAGLLTEAEVLNSALVPNALLSVASIFFGEGSLMLGLLWLDMCLASRKLQRLQASLERTRRAVVAFLSCFLLASLSGLVVQSIYPSTGYTIVLIAVLVLTLCVAMLYILVLVLLRRLLVLPHRTIRRSSNDNVADNAAAELEAGAGRAQVVPAAGSEFEQRMQDMLATCRLAAISQTLATVCGVLVIVGDRLPSLALYAIGANAGHCSIAFTSAVMSRYLGCRLDQLIRKAKEVEHMLHYNRGSVGARGSIYAEQSARPSVCSGGCSGGNTKRLSVSYMRAPAGSTRGSVRASVRASVRGSVRASVRSSVGARSSIASTVARVSFDGASITPTCRTSTAAASVRFSCALSSSASAAPSSLSYPAAIQEVRESDGIDLEEVTAEQQQQGVTAEQQQQQQQQQGGGQRQKLDGKTPKGKAVVKFAPALEMVPSAEAHGFDGAGNEVAAAAAAAASASSSASLAEPSTARATGNASTRSLAEGSSSLSVGKMQRNKGGIVMVVATEAEEEEGGGQPTEVGDGFFLQTSRKGGGLYISAGAWHSAAEPEQASPVLDEKSHQQRSKRRKSALTLDDLMLRDDGRIEVIAKRAVDDDNAASE